MNVGGEGFVEDTATYTPAMSTESRLSSPHPAGHSCSSEARRCLGNRNEPVRHSLSVSPALIGNNSCSGAERVLIKW